MESGRIGGRRRMEEEEEKEGRRKWLRGGCVGKVADGGGYGRLEKRKKKWRNEKEENLYSTKFRRCLVNSGGN